MTSEEQKQYRAIGGRLAVVLRQRQGERLTPATLQAIAADLLGERTELLPPLKELVSRPGFQQLLTKAGSGRGAVERRALLTDLEKIFTPAVITTLEEILNGFLDLPSGNVAELPEQRTLTSAALLQSNVFPQQIVWRGGKPALLAVCIAAIALIIAGVEAVRHPAVCAVVGLCRNSEKVAEVQRIIGEAKHAADDLEQANNPESRRNAAERLESELRKLSSMTLSPKQQDQYEHLEAISQKAKSALESDDLSKSFDKNGSHLVLTNSNKTGQIKSGPIQVNAELFSDKDSSGLATKTALVSVQIKGQEVGRLSTPRTRLLGGGTIVQLAELDPTNKYPEVIMSWYTGGAHCCAQVEALTSDPAGSRWSKVRFEMYDGGPEPAKDLLGNGVYYIVAGDGRFRYRFSSYSCSWVPTRILRLAGETIKDDTFEQAFVPYHIGVLRNMEKSLPRAGGHDDTSCINGMLAGYVAVKSLVGEFNNGWERMMNTHNRNSEEGLRECLAGYNERLECDSTETIYNSFPAALRALLQRTGYIKANV